MIGRRISSLGRLARVALAAGGLASGMALAQTDAPSPAPAPEGTPAPAPEGTPAPAMDASPVPAAQAPTPLPEGDIPEWKKVPKPRGYFRSELRWHDPHLGYVWSEAAGGWIPVGSPYLSLGLVPYAPREGYVEANTELKYAPSYNLSIYGDLSAIYSTVGPATSVFEDQALALGVSYDLTQLPQTRVVKREEERLQINELYVNGYVGDHLLLLGGKRRTYWGSSFTWTPADYVNPARNPLEPSLERQGTWSALADLSFEHFTFSVLWAPFEMDDPRGIPANWSVKRGTYVGRLYVNPWYQDVNVIYALNDDVYPNLARHRVGLTYSGYPVGTIEVHGEASLQIGRTTYLVTRRSPTTAFPDLEAPYQVGQDELEDGRLHGDFLVGSRYNFVDNSFLLVEYLYRNGGYDRGEYERFREYASYLEEALPALEALLDPALTDAGTVPAGLEEDLDAAVESWTELLSGSPFLFQEAFLRRHYLAVAYQKGWIRDRYSPGINTILSLEDGTVILYPQVQWRMNDALLLQVGGSAAVGPRGSMSELLPDRYALNLRLTARY